MNSTALTKPVMDVAAPSGPVSAPAAPARKAVSAASLASSRLARPTRPALGLRSAGGALRQARTSSRPAPVSRAAGKKTAPADQASAQRGAPVALITVTVFAVLILSVLAVTAYVTFRVA